MESLHLIHLDTLDFPGRDLTEGVDGPCSDFKWSWTGKHVVFIIYKDCLDWDTESREEICYLRYHDICYLRYQEICYLRYHVTFVVMKWMSWIEATVNLLD